MSDIILCQWEGFSCMGCCGRDFKGKRAIVRDVRKNTVEFEAIKNPEKFRDRAHKDDLRNSGICRNLIEKDNKVFCAIHPVVIKSRKDDLRNGHCDTHYWCQTMLAFRNWSEEKKKKFLDFIMAKNPNWAAYSMNIDNENYLKDFEKFQSE